MIFTKATRGEISGFEATVTQHSPAPNTYTCEMLSPQNPSETTSTPKVKSFRLGEFFCGPGGIAKGAQLASISDPDFKIIHQWANDFDKDTVDTYSLNITGQIGSESVIHGDVKELDFQRLHDLGDIDAFAFGFPCNDFSTVGERKGFDGTFGPLYTYGIGVLNEFKPKWFIAENVSGLSSNSGGQAFQTILTDMRNSGYRLVPHLYKFEQYGVPQARHRIIIVGIRDDLNVTFRVPNPKQFADIDVSAKTALTNPPISELAPNQERTRQSANVIERLKLIKPGQNVFTAELPEHLQIKTRTQISQIYRRLHPDKPSYTVTGSGGGGTHVYHWQEPRALTNRERARLQTFPDDYKFIGSKESVRKQIGMAVPVDGAKIIFEAILKTFAGVEYDHIDSSIPPII